MTLKEYPPSIKEVLSVKVRRLGGGAMEGLATVRSMHITWLCSRRLANCECAYEREGEREFSLLSFERERE